MNRTRMSRKLVGAVAAVVSAVALFVAVPARSLTINDGGACASWSWDQSTATLTCTPASGGGVPACTVTGPNGGVVNSSVTLTASCSPAATSWLWTGGSCAGTTASTCAATATATGNVSYTVTGTNATGPGAASAAKVVSWTNSLPAKPTGCTVTPSPASLPAGGGQVTLTMVCTGGAAATSYTWSGPGATFSGGAGTTTNSNTATITATTGFTVTASNAGGDTAAQASVQVGQTDTISCAAQGFSKTLVVPWSWSSNITQIDTWANTGMGTNGILVVPFTPTEPADVNNLSAVSASSYPAGQVIAPITVSISSTPCELYAPAPGTATGIDAVGVKYGVGTVGLRFGKPNAVALTPGVKYYVNVAWRENVSATNPYGTQTCVAGMDFYPNCNVRLGLSKPAGH